MANVSLAPESRTDGQTDPAVCTVGPTGSPWALARLRGARDPVARGVSRLFSLSKKQKHLHMFSDRQKPSRNGTLVKPCLPARWVVGDHPPITRQARHTSAPEGSRDRGPALCHPGQKPPSSAARSLPPAKVPLPTSVTLWLRWPPPHSCSHHLQAGFFSSNRSSALQRLQEGVLSPPQSHLCPFLHTSPFTCWKHERGEDWSILTLPGQKQNNKKQKRKKKKKFRMKLRERDKTRDFQSCFLR